MSDAFIAVDWGTTNRRAFVIREGAVVATERDDHGAAMVPRDDYPAEVAGIRARLGELPMLLAGMVGSTIGWRQVPYVAAPAGFEEIVAALDYVDDRTAIVPGLCYRDAVRADVMRGEEVQLLGAFAAGSVPADGLLAQPGTHCKWARLEGGRITGFTTAMTGELFSLLRAHSLLRHQMDGTAQANDAFLAGVAEGARHDLAASLFAIRARAVLGAKEDATSFASGLLIGGDVAARIVSSETVYILADPPLSDLYSAAVTALGGTPHIVGSRASFVAGITRIREMTA
ncbi:2-dehydro-3-deoxygalactonokinase [Sphingomonas sp.]|jgi:2-dehydro-3-deoxygalactonokinase|uniref:2-dehydro-3-deoxygalactonokinase n=1 Tax=Sphingomonas sp. TaxID=28214 RepID=UPI002ED7901D